MNTDPPDVDQMLNWAADYIALGLPDKAMAHALLAIATMMRDDRAEAEEHPGDSPVLCPICSERHGVRLT